MSDIPEKTRALIRERSLDLCELCRRPMAAIHHLDPKGMGGTSRADIHRPSNLIALDVRCHSWVHGNVAWAEAGGWIRPTSQGVWMQSQHYAYPAWFELFDGDAGLRWLGDSDEPAHLPPGLPSLRLDPWVLDASA